MAKRGRKKKQNVDRTASGRISRAMSSYNENAEPIARRMRRLGLSEKDARDQRAATVHGLMFLRQKITEAQYQAGEKMIEVRRNYLKAIKAPDSLAVTSAFGGGLSDDTNEYVNWCDRAKDRHEAARKAIYAAQAVHRHANLWGALDCMLWRNEYHPHMEGDFSTILRVLSVHFGLTEIRKSDGVGDEMSLRPKCA